VRPFNADGDFVSGLATDGGAIRRMTVRGAGATMFAGGLALVIQLCSTMVLARILMPRDFGLVAMVTTFSLLLVNFGFNGLTEAIVQREDVSHDLASTLFWINTGFGILLTIGFAGAGTLLAQFYHDPLVTRVTEGISLTIIVTSLSTVHLALLKRAMLFPLVSLNDVCGRLVSVILSIALAWAGFGYWALVAGVVVIPLTTCIGGWIFCRWIPGPPRRVPQTASTLRFAVNTYGTFAVNYGARNTDNLLVGWRFNASSLGFYKKAYDLFALPANQLVASIAVVVVAGLSRAKQDPSHYRRAILDALSMMAFVGMWVGAVLTVVGKDLILVLLGPKWGPSGQIFTFFGPGIGIMILYTTHGWIHLSAGRPDRYLRWDILEFVVTIALFGLGLHWGPPGVAVAWSASFWILTVPGIWYAGKPIHLKITSVLSVVWRFIVASLFTVATIVLLSHAVPSFSLVPGTFAALIRVVTTTLATGVIYGGAVVLLHGGHGPMRQVISLFREVIQRRRPVEPQEESDGGQKAQPPLEMKETAPVKSPEHVPLVSILIPAYNAEEWIPSTLKSALAQTWPRTEIIVVDDGSKDATVAIARQFEPRGVRVISQRNQGASAARNNAFSQCHGDYIQWLDADDLLAPDKIAKQMEFVMAGGSKETLLSSPWGRFMYRHSRARFIPSDLWRDLTPQEWLLRKMDQNIYMQTASWLVSRELTEAAGPWDIRLLGDDDGEYFCRVLLASNGVHFVHGANVYYRAFRFDSLSFIGRFPRKIEAHWISMQLHIKYLRSLGDDDRARAACLQYLRDALIYFYPERSHILDEANELAKELGGTLGTPYLSWKYRWLTFCFGWVAVKPTQNFVRKIRWGLATKLDYLLYRLEERKSGTVFTQFPGAGNAAGEIPGRLQ
jgi:O-antigen/teichoic acid export membrane protein/glycosyltransferase involved in cell wall biosynthesis